MISITTAELNALIASFIYPLTRILALLVSAPPFSNNAVPVRIRLILGLTIAMAIAPTIEIPQAIVPGSAMGMLTLAAEMLVGLAMGLSIRMVFSAVDLGGNIISNQMGLGFATSYDPAATSQTVVVSEVLGFLTLLTFLAVDGHLMIIATLVKSFQAIPVGKFLAPDAWLGVAESGRLLFSAGVLLALPSIVALLITNIALGVLCRVSPQLNLMVIGFPTTIIIGFVALLASLSHLSGPLRELFDVGLASMLGNFGVVGH